MSKLSYLEKLLDGAGVEWKPLGEVIKLEKGRQLNKELLSGNGLYPAYNGGVSHSGFTDNYNYNENTIIISQDGASAGFINFVTSKFYANAHCYVVLPRTDIVQNRYVYHFLKLNQEKLTNKQHGAGIPALRTSEILDIPIPIPCPENQKKSLAIQAEIVRILDAFTQLAAELAAELTARKKQYDYYREQLLTFEDGEVEWKPLGHESVGQFIRGSGLQKKDFTETGVGCIHYGQIYTYYGPSANKTKTFVSEEFAEKSRKARTGDLVIATTSENDEDVCKAVAWLGREDIAVSSDACIYRHMLNPKYVSYFFQTEHFQKQKNPYITGTKVRRVNADDLSKILIPIPYSNNPEKSLAEQARIVTILDKFDALTNSISEGLPREIELRQKQYEYYRDLLFNFPKPEELAA